MRQRSDYTCCSIRRCSVAGPCPSKRCSLGRGDSSCGSHEGISNKTTTVRQRASINILYPSAANRRLQLPPRRCLVGFNISQSNFNLNQTSARLTNPILGSISHSCDIASQRFFASPLKEIYANAVVPNSRPCAAKMRESQK